MPIGDDDSINWSRFVTGFVDWSKIATGWFFAVFIVFFAI
jgi:hypothetical protein